MTNRKTLAIYEVDVAKDHPARTVQHLAAAVPGAGVVFTLAFRGYDADPRELRDVPEVQAWCRAFVQAGGLDHVAGLDADLPDGSSAILALDYSVLGFAKMAGVRWDTTDSSWHFSFSRVAQERRRWSTAS